MGKCEGKMCRSTSQAFRRTLLSGYGNSYSDEAISLFNQWEALGTPASSTRKTLVNNTIVALKNANIWDELDVLYMFAAHSELASYVDWKNPTTRSCTKSGTVNFVADSYIQGNGTTGYLDSNFNAGSGATYKFTQNSHSMGIYINEYTATNHCDFSTQDAGGIGTFILNFFSTGTWGQSQIRSLTATNKNTDQMTVVGCNSFRRIASNSYKFFNNGFITQTAPYSEVSSPPANRTIKIAVRDINGTLSNYSTRKYSYYFAGSGVFTQYDLSNILNGVYLNELNVVPRKRLFINGSSIGGNANWIKVTRDSLGYNYGYGAVARPGQETTVLTSEFPTSFGLLTNTYFTKNILFFWELTNDMATNVGNVTVCYNNLLAYCALAKAAGYAVVVGTMLPRTGATTRQNDADLYDDTTLNGYIRNHLIQDGHADYIIDFGADLTMGQNNQELNLTYYDVDGIHPNSTGYTYLANTIITPALITILA